MELPTATVFAVVGWGIILAKLEKGFFSIMASDSSGGVVVRQVMFLMALFPPLVGLVAGVICVGLVDAYTGRILAGIGHGIGHCADYHPLGLPVGYGRTFAYRRYSKRLSSIKASWIVWLT